jgi:hypothetical protein
MKTLALCLLACLMLIPKRIWSQPEQAMPPEIRLVLIPTAFADGVATKFTFVLTNVSGGDISIPPPEFDCSTPSPNGFIRFRWVFVPVNCDGKGIGSGIGSCGPGGSIYPRPALTVGSLTKNWASLHPGESLRVPANWPLGFGVMLSGTYTFSARYLPPQLSSEAERLLSEAGIVIPRQEVETPEQNYVRP